MVNFLHRTTTFQVYELILEKNTTNEKIIFNQLVKLDRKRTLSDTRGMIDIIKSFGLLEE